MAQFSRGSRTALINQAIAEKLEQLEQAFMKKKLLAALQDAPMTASQGISTEDTLLEIRNRETNHLIFKS